MTGPFGGGSGGPFGTSATKQKKVPNFFSRITPDIIEKPVSKAAGLPFGFVGNLLSDVKDAVVGLPMGLVSLARDPIASGKAVGQSMWTTWGPLFQGKPIKFVQGVYDHPLAPILDVAAVFTLGVGTAARGASTLSKVGVGGTKMAKVAGLRSGGVRILEDPAGIGAPVEKILSQRAGRRLVQDGMYALERYLPSWYSKPVASMRYNRTRLIDMAHRSGTKDFIKVEASKRGAEIEKALAEGNLSYLAARFQTEAVLRGAEALEDITDLGKRARSTVVAHMHANLIRHNKAVPLAQAKKMSQSGHWRAIKAPEYMDPKYQTTLLTKQAQYSKLAQKHSKRMVKEDAEIRRLEEVRRKNAELAHSIEKIERELREAGNHLQSLMNTGYRVGHPAKTKTGRVIPEPKGRQQMTYESEALYDATRRVTELEELRSQALKAKGIHEDTLQRLEHLRRRREDRMFNLVRMEDELNQLRNRSADDYYAWAGDNYGQFQSTVDNFGRIALTRDFRLALKDDRGYIYMAPKHDAYHLAYEGGGSLRLLHAVLHKPTMLWKRAVLLYTPRIIANNAVGNWFLYMVRNADPNGMRGIADTLIERYGSKMAHGEALFPTNHWLYRWFSDELGADTFLKGNLLDETGRIRGALGRAGREGFYGIQYEWAEKPIRAATIRRALLDQPEIRARVKELRGKGMNRRKALEKAVDEILPNRPDLRDRAALESRRLAGDYITLSETEKFARDVIPFYLWQRHILKTTGNMALDQPGRLAVGARISELGIEETRKMIGEVPEFLRGALPLAALGGGSRPGRANVLITSSLNPFATVGEMADGLEALLTGKGNRRGFAITGFGVNPYITGIIESATEKNLLTGTASPREGGAMADALSRIALALPHLRAADALSGKHTDVTPGGTDYLYARNTVGPLTWLSGFTVRDLSKAAASALAAKERGETVKKRKGPYG